jgi:hypothetical protein
MVEVFKTNVEDPLHAGMLVEQIHMSFADYKANFDLQDCDRILRIACTGGLVQASSVIDLVKDHGFHAEILPDDLPGISHANVYPKAGSL